MSVTTGDTACIGCPCGYTVEEFRILDDGTADAGGTSAEPLDGDEPAWEFYCRRCGDPVVVTMLDFL